jgi:hypothetical protein
MFYLKLYQKKDLKCEACLTHGSKTGVIGAGCFEHGNEFNMSERGIYWEFWYKFWKIFGYQSIIKVNKTGNARKT